MRKTQDIPWPRIGAESVAVIGSILLAFAIDAWWEGRNEAEQANTLAVSLHADFQVSHAELERALDEQRRYQSAAQELLAALRSAELDSEIGVEMELILRSILAPTYSPTTSALELAISSGQIDLIEDQELRNTLADWRRHVADNAEEEQLLTEIASNQLIPELSKHVRLGGVLNSDTMTTIREHKEASVRLRATSELEGVLAQRVFFGNFVVQELSRIGDTQIEVLRMLELRISE